MTTKLNTVLLIDDNEATNYLHKRLIQQSGLVENVMVMQYAGDALEYLQTTTDPRPDLIFLDINMPAMSGWEFLEDYEKLLPEQKSSIVIIMLTTSLNPDDRANADNFEAVREFCNKPLIVHNLKNIIDKHFVTH